MPDEVALPPEVTQPHERMGTSPVPTPERHPLGPMEQQTIQIIQSGEHPDTVFQQVTQIDRNAQTVRVEEAFTSLPSLDVAPEQNGIAANKQQQDKIIAIISRVGSSFLPRAQERKLQEIMQDKRLVVSAGEKENYLRGVANGIVGEVDYKKVLNNIENSLDIRYKGKDDTLFSQIGEDPARLVILADKVKHDGNLYTEMSTADLTNLLNEFKTAYDFSQAKEEYLAKVGDAYKDRYEQAYDDLGKLLYGKQWEYFQQMQLLEEESEAMFGSQKWSKFYKREKSLQRQEQKKRELIEKAEREAQDLQKKEQEASPEKETRVAGVGFIETQGRRRTMEDAHVIKEAFGNRKDQAFFAIYDGHGGRRAADFAAEKLHEKLLQKLQQGIDPSLALNAAFLETDREILASGIQDGATALAAFMQGETLFIANAGDARAVMKRNGQAVRLSHDHKASDTEEQFRIHNAGGRVIKDMNGTYRVNGSLAVARALGDAHYKPAVTAEPFIAEEKITEKDEALILACDGMWDVISDDEAFDLIKNEPDPQKAAIILKNEALLRGSGDNISVMVVGLQKEMQVNQDSREITTELALDENSDVFNTMIFDLHHPDMVKLREYMQTEEYKEALRKNHIESAFNRWKYVIDRKGKNYLRNYDEMRDKFEFNLVEKGKVSYVVAKEHEQKIEEFEQIRQQVETAIGIPIPEKRKRTMDVIVVPDKKYVPRAAATGEGNSFLVDAQDKGGVYAHEYTHEYLAQLFGRSHSDTATEGAAVYFGTKGAPHDKRANDVAYLYGYSDVGKIKTSGNITELSHTAVLDIAGKGHLSDEDKYEYSYRYGGYFAEFIINKFGKDAYLEFYKQTCLESMVDSTTGASIVFDGRLVGKERDLNKEAIRRMIVEKGISNTSAEQINLEFNQYLQAEKPGFVHKFNKLLR